MRSHLLRRVGWFLLGLVLFYAPMALLPRLVLAITGNPLLPDVHRLCLRMPFEWALQPWMYPTMFREPIYLFGPLVLPLSALLIGAMFCGWLCPAGVFTELVSRVVPPRFQLQLGGRIDPVPIRLGVLLGMMLSPFLGSYVCCTFCNFTSMQALVSAVFGDFVGLQAWAGFTMLTMFVWLVVLGLFTRGGRGWCNLLCPAGAVMGLAASLGDRLPFSRRVRIDQSRCSGCGECTQACPAWAISKARGVNQQACNLCRDCLFLCPEGAIEHRRR